MMMIKTAAFALVVALTTFAATARAQTPSPAARALFDRCAQAAARERTAPRTVLDLDLVEVALAAAEKGQEVCAGLVQRLLIKHAEGLASMSSADRARAEMAYARAYAAFKAPALEKARQKLAAYAIAQ